MEYKWTSDLTYRLISMYKERENLWKSNHYDYRNRYKRAESLTEIAQELNVDKRILDNKIHNLRCQWRNERKKENTATCFSGKVYKSKWEFFEALQFAFSGEDDNTGSVENMILAIPDVQYEENLNGQNESPFQEESRQRKPSPIPAETLISQTGHSILQIGRIWTGRSALQAEQSSPHHGYSHHGGRSSPHQGSSYQPLQSSLHQGQLFQAGQLSLENEPSSAQTGSAMYETEQSPERTEIACNKRRRSRNDDDQQFRKCGKCVSYCTDKHQIFVDYVASEMRNYPAKYAQKLKYVIQKTMLEISEEIMQESQYVTEEVVVKTECE